LFSCFWGFSPFKERNIHVTLFCPLPHPSLLTGNEADKSRNMSLFSPPFPPPSPLPLSDVPDEQIVERASFFFPPFLFFFSPLPPSSLLVDRLRLGKSKIGLLLSFFNYAPPLSLSSLCHGFDGFGYQEINSSEQLTDPPLFFSFSFHPPSPSLVFSPEAMLPSGPNLDERLSSFFFFFWLVSAITQHDGEVFFPFFFPSLFFLFHLGLFYTKDLAYAQAEGTSPLFFFFLSLHTQL